MNVYFVRSNGDYSVHSLPGRPEEFVPGEPEGAFNYRRKCLDEGFARIGWPNTGDLGHGFRGRLAPDGYRLESVKPVHRRYLEAWSGIRTGDLIVIPADGEKYQVHLGVVVKRDRGTREELPTSPGEPAYYYSHDVTNRDFYECAHRVDVRWHRTPGGAAAVHRFTELGGVWPKAFARVHQAAEKVREAAVRAGWWTSERLDSE